MGDPKKKSAGRLVAEGGKVPIGRKSGGKNHGMFTALGSKRDESIGMKGQGNQTGE